MYPQGVVAQQEEQLRAALERQEALSLELEERREQAETYQVGRAGRGHGCGCRGKGLPEGVEGDQVVRKVVGSNELPCSAMPRRRIRTLAASPTEYCPKRGVNVGSLASFMIGILRRAWRDRLPVNTSRLSTCPRAP